MNPPFQPRGTFFPIPNLMPGQFPPIPPMGIMNFIFKFNLICSHLFLFLQSNSNFRNDASTYFDTGNNISCFRIAKKMILINDFNSLNLGCKYGYNCTNWCYNNNCSSCSQDNTKYY